MYIIIHHPHSLLESVLIYAAFLHLLFAVFISNDIIIRSLIIFCSLLKESQILKYL